MKSKNQDTWDLSPLYKSDNDPRIIEDRKSAETILNAFVNKWEKNEKYLKDPKTLLQAITEYEQMILDNGLLSNEEAYLFLRTSQDSINTDLKASQNIHNDLMNKHMNKVQFFTYRISKIPENEQKKFLNYAPLSKYKHYLEKLFSEAKYLLSEDVEKVLLITTKTSHSNWTDMTEEFLYAEEREITVDGEKKKLGLDSLLNIATTHKDEATRDNATNLVNEILRKWLPVATKELNTVLEYKRNIDEIRGFKRADEERLLSDDINPEFVDPLLEAVTERFDISQRYYALKAKLLGKKKLKYNERMLTVGSYDRKYSYQEAKEIVLNLYQKLDSELYNIVKAFFDEKRVDVFPQKGKRGGAFCSISLSTHPIYILLNHTEEVHDVTTLAHELGHGVNHVLMQRNCSELNYTSSKSTAEVASTFFEDFAIEEIAEGLSQEDRLTIMIKKLDGDVASIFRQIAFYKFEQELHVIAKEKGYLSEKEIGELFIKHMKSYLGDAVSYEEGCENWWEYVGHFRYFFYVYSYASGLLVSKALQDMVKENHGNINLVKDFLSKGGEMSPLDIFKSLGLDVTTKEFWNKGIAKVEKLLDETEELAKKLGKI